MLPCFTAMAQSEVTISTTASEGSIALVVDGTMAPIVVADDDADVVKTTALCLAGDIEAVTGKRPEVMATLTVGSAPVIAGTLGQSSLIDQLAAKGKIDAAAVSNKWEVYGLQVVSRPADGIERALVVYGSTPRGTAYGLLELSRQMGVSPYI